MQTLNAEDYARAERLLHGDKLVFGLELDPHWIPEGDQFWYRNTTKNGKEFIMVDPATASKSPAFDHQRLAEQLSMAAERPCLFSSLPFDDFRVIERGKAIEFDAFEIHWRCDLESYGCEALNPVKADREPGVASPDGQWAAFVRAKNLLVRRVEGEEVVALTEDGEPGYGYGMPVIAPLFAAGIAPAKDLPLPAVIWSPDSNMLISHRVDERKARKFNLVQSVPLDGSLYPKHYSYTYPLPGDEEVAWAELYIYTVKGQRQIKVDTAPLPILYYGTPIRPDLIWWNESSDTVYVVQRERGYQGYSLMAINAGTGATRVLLSEHADTGIDPHLTSGGRPNIRVVEHGAGIIWFSQRDGWGHLYMYDAATGALRNRITGGAFAVVDILHVDEANRLVYFTAVGKEPGSDPYYRRLYRASFDGGEAELLSPEDADHTIKFSPSGCFFVDTYSTSEIPPVTVLRRSDGKTVCQLLEADASMLVEMGWAPAERFRVKARDGVTDVCGIIVRPCNFRSQGKVPVIDDIYGGPQVNRAHASFIHSAEKRTVAFWQAQALAELGFVVVMIDGLGMPLRHKKYQDAAFKNLGDAGLPDHIAALRQLAARYPYMDLEKVGIFGHSAGGYSSAHAILAYPHFFKVAVSTAGNHHHGLDKAVWVERYMGFPVGEHYKEQANSSLAGRLEGKLLLMHGEMDENVHVASTLELIDALIKANKDFDLVILPNRPHGCTDDPYFVRKRWDYFVRHLLGCEPPKGYRITK